MSSSGNIIWFEKNRHFKYTSCSESFAEAAGEDSPESLNGKSDDDLTWQFEGHACDISDGRVQIIHNLNTEEWVRTAGGWKQVLVGKHSDARGRINGNLVICETVAEGFLNDYSNSQSIYVPALRDKLTHRDLVCLSFVMGAIPKKKAAEKLGVTENAIYKRVEKLTNAFQVRNKHELVIELNRLGLTSVVYALLRHDLV